MADSLQSSRRGSMTDWISVVVAGVALVVSSVSLMQSCDATHKTQQQVEREQASQVAFTRSPNTDGTETLSIANHSHLIMSDIVLSFNEGSYLRVGSLEGCKIWQLSPLSKTDSVGGTVTVDEPTRLDFSDAQDPPEAWTILDSAASKQKDKPKKLTDLTSTFSGVVSDMQHCS